MRLFYYKMNKNNVPGNTPWSNYESQKPGGSLIVNYNQNNHHPMLNQKPSPKYKLDELYQKQQHQQQLIARHSSD